MVSLYYKNTISTNGVTMKKYKLIARENIVGITTDEGLKRLNGYAELYREYSDDKPYNEVANEMTDQIITQYPSAHFAQFECTLISDEGESN